MTVLEMRERILKIHRALAALADARPGSYEKLLADEAMRHIERLDEPLAILCKLEDRFGAYQTDTEAAPTANRLAREKPAEEVKSDVSDKPTAAR